MKLFHLIGTAAVRGLQSHEGTLERLLNTEKQSDAEANKKLMAADLKRMRKMMKRSKKAGK